MRFKARRDAFFTIIFLATTLLICGVVVLMIIDKELNPTLFIVLIAQSLLVSVFFNTYYQINNAELFYRSGFFKGTIDILTIRELEVNTTMWAGNKPALARNGIIIKYNKYDDIYVSPKKQNEFITELLKINSEIKVVTH